MKKYASTIVANNVTHYIANHRFGEDAVSSLALDNSAVFLGVNSDIVNIKRLVFSSSVSNRRFGINKLSIAAVPESSFTFGLIAFGALGAVTLKRKLNRIS